MFKYLSIFLVCVSAPAWAAFGSSDVGTTAAAFLKLGSGARPEALGEAYVGLADDASGIAYNPAGMAQNLSGEIEASHAIWFQGLTYDNLNAILSMGDGGMIGGTFNFLSVPQITRTEQIANTSDPSQNYIAIGSFSPYDMQAAIAYARPLFHNLLVGANFKLINQSIDTYSTFGIGLDLGLLYEAPIKGLTAGLAFQNMGTPIKLESEAFGLPFDARAGAAYRAFDNQVLFTGEADLPVDNSPVLAIGAEYNIANRFFPRVGYRYNDIFNPWTLGFGLQYDEWGLDLSVVPYGELGMTYRASVNWRFGKPGASLDARFPYASTAGTGKSAVMDAQMSAPDKVQAWALYIYDSGRPARIVRTLSGSGPMDAAIQWDGKNKEGQPAPEGVYWGILTVRYATGQTVNSKYVRLEISNSVPVVDLSIDAASINTHAAGEAFVPTGFRPVLKSARGILAWRVEVLDPQGKVFRSISGDGPPPDMIVWDGKDDAGNELISAQVYSARLWVKDALGSEGVSPAPVSFKAVFR